MTLFLLTFFSIYGGMHLYLFLKLLRAFRFSRQAAALLFCTLLLLTCAPILVRTAERLEYDQIAPMIAWPGFIWMGFIFILTTLFLAADIIAILSCPFRKKRSTVFHSPDRGRRASMVIILLMATISTLYGLYEAATIHPVRVTIKTDKIPPSVGRIRVVQVSDVHIGLIIRERQMRRIIKAIEEAKPDLLVSSGDFIDGRLSRRETGSSYRAMTDMLAAVTTPLGKYAVSGNHEYFAGIDQAMNVTARAGFKVLHNEYVQVAPGLIISGVDDKAWKRMGLPAPPGTAEPELLKTLPADAFRIHLKHRPLIDPNGERLFDLQLSGHTHHGQIFPFFLLTKIQFPLPGGTVQLKNGATLHTSNGTGTWGPPIRLFAAPEITIIDLVPELKKP